MRPHPAEGICFLCGSFTLDSRWRTGGGFVFELLILALIMISRKHSTNQNTLSHVNVRKQRRVARQPVASASTRDRLSMFPLSHAYASQALEHSTKSQRAVCVDVQACVLSVRVRGCGRGAASAGSSKLQITTAEYS